MDAKSDAVIASMNAEQREWFAQLPNPLKAGFLNHMVNHCGPGCTGCATCAPPPLPKGPPPSEVVLAAVEYKYEYGENKWQKVIDSEIIGERMYFLTDREQWTGFVLEYNGNMYPITYKLNGCLDDDERATDMLEELGHSVMVKRIKSYAFFVADTIWIKEDNSPGEWEFYNEIEDWEALHEIEEYFEKLQEAAVEQWDSFDGGLEVLNEDLNENVLYLTTSIEGEGADAVKRGYAIQRINNGDRRRTETRTAYTWHDDGRAVLLDPLHGAKLIAYQPPDPSYTGQAKLYVVADDEFRAELRKSNRFLAVDYYEDFFIGDEDPEDLPPPGHYAGSNWNEVDEGPPLTPAIEERVINDECLVCFEKFKENEKVSKWRCGHCFCFGCAAAMKEHGWKRCTTCRKSKTAREVEYTTP
jgi:hypothetical protein